MQAWRLSAFIALPFAVAAMGAGAACSSSEGGGDSSTDGTCSPVCQDRACGDDGCGGSCGSCPLGQACAADGACEPDCSRGCADFGLQCGEHCGEDCGSCAAGTHCAGGLCACSPSCAGQACGADDGCGGSCGPCPTDISCEGCALSLRLVERVVEQGRVTAVVAAIDFDAADGATLPALADLRLDLSGPAELVQVGLGQALMDAGKELYPEPSTGRRFHRLDDGTHQLLAMSPRSTNPIGEGRWIFLRFRFVEDGRGDAPLVARLLSREKTFAPKQADQALWSSPPTGELVVWPVDLAPAATP